MHSDTAVVWALFLGLGLWFLARHVAPITSLTASLTMQLVANASQTLSSVSSSVSALTNGLNIQKKSTFSATGSATANAANQVASKLYSIAATASTTIDLSAAITNLVNASTATFARIKAVSIRLLSTTDDSVNGTACSSITVGNAASNAWTTQSGSGGFGTATSVMDVANGGFFIPLSNDNAAGVLVDGTHKSLKILNNDAVVAAAVELTLIGADA